jgi:hypothetical protein
MDIMMMEQAKADELKYDGEGSEVVYGLLSSRFYQ